jgi:aminoglycoside phosphotransferase family enzyme/predicted kinase
MSSEDLGGAVLGGAVLGGAGHFGARVVETHLSVLFFLGDRVYKLRKPVHFDFVDFTDRGAREADCHREVEANRRFAPDVYLGVFDVVDEGTPVDHLVVMRSLPDDRCLSTLVRSGAPLRSEIRSIARVLADTDAWLLRSHAIDEHATRDAVAAAWKANFDEMVPFVGRMIDQGDDARIAELVNRFLGGRDQLFHSRISGGRIRDGHGDLEADDIFCLIDGPRILDCIEFDDHLRFGDVVADLAFLGMDLEHLGDASLSDALFDDFAELSGDTFPRSLRDHYGASCAYVRAKVSCLAASEGAPGALETARQMHRLALAMLERSQVRLVLVGGSPGTGKSTMASHLADDLDMVLLSSDEIRKELAGAASAVDVGTPSDLYSDEMTELTYATMCSRAKTALDLGASVILDATWVVEPMREKARAMAEEARATVTEICCSAPDALSDRRINERLARGDDASDATVDVARRMREGADPWPQATVVDTSGVIDQSLGVAVEAIISPH